MRVAPPLAANEPMAGARPEPGSPLATSARGSGGGLAPEIRAIVQAMARADARRDHAAALRAGPSLSQGGVTPEA